MSKYSDLITELGSYVTDVEDIKQSIKDIADNKNITITEDVDTPLSVLEKIDLGTIETPTETLNIDSNGIVDVTNYAEVNISVASGGISIESELWFCNSSNASTSVDLDDSYTTTLSPEEDFTMTGATVKVEMGGVDITSTTYNNGVISIAQVTDTVKIYAKAVVSTVGCIIFGSDSSFSVGLKSAKNWDSTVEYSTDKSTWTTWDGTTINAVANNGSYRVYLRGTSNTYFSTYNGFAFSTTFDLIGTDIICCGNIENLLDYSTVLNNSHPPMASYCFYSLFYGCDGLIYAPELKANTVSQNGYQQMFSYCSNLKEAPELPATAINSSSYASMFQYCASLRKAPTISATSLQSSCFSNMFSGCTSLVTPPILPSTFMAIGCYSSMFYGCTSLTTMPELPATNLQMNCYSGMFYGCTSLVNVKELPATSVPQNAYQNMFYNCTSLTTAPNIKATTVGQNAFYYMFYGCINLLAPPTLSVTSWGNQCCYHMFEKCLKLKIPNNYSISGTLNSYCFSNMFLDCVSIDIVPENMLPATTLYQYCYQNMFYNCSSLTAAPALPATTLANYCYSGMFINCFNLDTPPALPATTLATGCYTEMFSGCRLLNTLPELPVITLPNSCYQLMFSNCKAIKLSATQTGDYQNEYRIPYDPNDTGTAGSNSLYNMFSSTGGTFTGAPTINTTYYTSNAIINSDGTITPGTV